MSELLRIGIIGGGVNSAVGAAHVAAIRMDGAFALGPCLFSHVQEINRASHDCYRLPWSGHEKTLGRWLDRHAGELDVVAILTPSTDHAQHIEQVAARGLSFLSEKPVACTLAELDAVEAALKGLPGVRGRFVHNYSGYPMYRELVSRVYESRLGPIHHVRIQMPSDGFARERIVGMPQLWRRTDPEIPMIMLDLGTHMHHLVRMIVGKSEARVYARMHGMVNSIGVVDNVEIWEERADGISISYWMSKAHLGIKNGLSVDVYGADGALSWNQMDPDHLVQADIDSNCTIVNRGAISAEAARLDRFKAGHPTGFVEAFANFYADLAEDLCSEQSPGNGWIRPLEEAFDGLRFLAAAAQSSEVGGWVPTC